MTRLYVMFLFLAGTAAAQVNGTFSTSVRARLHFANGICDPFAHVQLIGRKGAIAEGPGTNDIKGACDRVRALGYKVEREPGPRKHGTARARSLLLPDRTRLWCSSSVTDFFRRSSLS